MRSTITPSPTPRLAALIGSSPEIRAIRDLIDRLASIDASVLVTGPSGSGKEVVAELLHQRGTRAARPFVAVNCVAGPRDLLESDLFGHEVGAFTGAAHARRGKFELADGGTLFLDEIGDMPPEFQAKLLRVLETRRVERVGGTGAVAVDVRVVAATNVDLPAAIAAGRFRADLFYRLAVVEIALPALAARPEDIPALIAHFAEATGYGQPPRFTASALAYLTRQPWLGNVREVRNVVARAAAIHGATEIDEPAAAILLYGERCAVDRWLATNDEPLPLPNRRRPPPLVAAEAVDLKALLTDFEQTIIRDALGRTAFGVAASARLLGMRRTTLVEKMRRHNIGRPGGV